MGADLLEDVALKSSSVARLLASLSRVPWRHTRSLCYTGVRPCRTISSSVCPDPNLFNVPFLSVKCLAEKRVQEGLGRHSPRRDARPMLPSQLARLAHLQILVGGLAALRTPIGLPNIKLEGVDRGALQRVDNRP